MLFEDGMTQHRYTLYKLDRIGKLLGILNQHLRFGPTFKSLKIYGVIIVFKMFSDNVP